jgi:hypothetical protein
MRRGRKGTLVPCAIRFFIALMPPCPQKTFEGGSSAGFPAAAAYSNAHPADFRTAGYQVRKPDA